MRERVERCAHAIEMADELAEHQRLVVVAEQFLHQLQENVELGARQRRVRVHQTGMAAGRRNRVISARIWIWR